MTQLHPVIRAAMNDLVGVAHANQLGPRITSTVRSRRRQAQLYRAWLAGRSRFPAARPGTSLHERGLAFDMVAERLPDLGALWISWGGRWFASDPIHFEAG